MRWRYPSHPLKALQLMVEIQALPRASEDPGSPAEVTRGRVGATQHPRQVPLPILSSATESSAGFLPLGAL